MYDDSSASIANRYAIVKTVPINGPKSCDRVRMSIKLFVR
jgi:hypothetical protein